MTLQGRSGITDRRSRPASAKRERAAQGRLGAVRPVAVIDIGSNSVRQVIYEGMTRSPAVLFNEKVLCGLGRGIQTTGRLDPAAIGRALAALHRFRALGRQADIAATHILATAAARDAGNGAEFLESVEKMFGREVTLLTGTKEAQYSAWGVRSGFFRPDGIVGDLGGGSLELVAINGEIGGGLTLPLGGLRLAESAGESTDAAKLIVERELASIKIAWPGSQRNFYAVGGTWRSLAKLHIAHSGYPLPVLHDYTVSAKSFIAFCKSVATKPLDKYNGIDAVSRNRRALLPFGALVMAGVIRKLKAEKVIMSSLGVREGYLYSMLPTQGIDGPAAGAEIVDGLFALSDDEGPVVGTNRIVIRSVQPTGRKVKHDGFIESDGAPQAGQMVEEFRNVIPPQYNSKSTLEWDIQSDTINKKEFDLTTVEPQ